MEYQKYTLQELANKIDWEGGIYETANGYGISENEIEADEEFLAAWKQLRAIAPIVDYIRDRLPEPVEDF